MLFAVSLCRSGTRLTPSAPSSWSASRALLPRRPLSLLHSWSCVPWRPRRRGIRLFPATAAPPTSDVLATVLRRSCTWRRDGWRRPWSVRWLVDKLRSSGRRTGVRWSRWRSQPTRSSLAGTGRSWRLVSLPRGASLVRVEWPHRQTGGQEVLRIAWIRRMPSCRRHQSWAGRYGVATTHVGAGKLCAATLPVLLASGSALGLCHAPV